uniref:Uncharacterized protein n=1 Tax=Sus scrofa TaxID=9823 RepID=A0A4X1SP54_PIG
MGFFQVFHKDMKWEVWGEMQMLTSKIKKLSRAWWSVPVVPATREAEAGGSLEPRSSGLQCAVPIRCPH